MRRRRRAWAWGLPNSRKPLTFLTPCSTVDGPPRKSYVRTRTTENLLRAFSGGAHEPLEASLRRLLTAAAIVALAVFPLPAYADPVTFTSTAVSNASNLCMNVPGGSSTNGTQLTQAACTGGAAQSNTFTPVAGTTDTNTIGTLPAGKC